MKTTITADDNIVAANCSFYLAENTPEGGYQELLDDANEPYRSTKKQEVLDRVEEAKEGLKDGHLFLVEEHTTITRL